MLIQSPSETSCVASKESELCVSCIVLRRGEDFLLRFLALVVPLVVLLKSWPHMRKVIRVDRAGVY